MQGSCLGLEISVSTTGIVSDISRRFEVCRRHFLTLGLVFWTLLARRLFSTPCATPAGAGCAEAPAAPGDAHGARAGEDPRGRVFLGVLGVGEHHVL